MSTIRAAIAGTVLSASRQRGRLKALVKSAPATKARTNPP